MPTKTPTVGKLSAKPDADTNAETPTVEKLSASTDTETAGAEAPRQRSRPAELLSDAIVRKLPAPASGARITYDGGDRSKRVTGFGVRVTAAGVRTFILNYRIDGIERRCSIGPYPRWTTAEARKEAEKRKRRIEDGHDPLLDKQEKREAPTMRDLIERWFADEAPKKTSERSRREDESLIRQWIDPKNPRFADRKPAKTRDGHDIANRKVAAISKSDIDWLHAKITARGTPVRANRTIAFLRHLFNLAIRWEMRRDNPAAGVRLNHEEPLERFLTPDELDRLIAALVADRNRTAARAIWLLILTGARSGEVFKATWPQFDLEAGVWTKPSSHTKQKKGVHRVPLSPAAVELLRGMKEEAEASARKQHRLPSLYLFPADLDRRYHARQRAKTDRGDGPIVSVKSTWQRVCKAARLEAVRPHDLRHSFASFAQNAGADLLVIGRLLGHTQLKTTMRYAHLFDEPLRAATGRVGAIVSAAANRQGEVIPLPQGKGEWRKHAKA